MLVCSRIVIGSRSPLSTQPYQTLASRSIVTRPTTVAFGAMKAVGWIVGRMGALSGMSFLAFQ
jgi:hypothetical protein